MSKSKKAVPKLALSGTMEVAREKITKESNANRDNLRWEDFVEVPYKTYIVSIKVDKKGNPHTTIYAKGKAIIKGKGYLDLLPKIEKLIKELEANPGKLRPGG